MFLLALALSVAVAAPGERPLLGVMHAPKEGKVTVVSVLDDAPAKDKLKPGDVLLKIADSPIKVDSDVAKILEKSKAGDEVAIAISRDGKEETVKITLVDRKDYKGDFLKPAKKGEGKHTSAVDFAAPEWHALWANLKESEAEPTKKALEGKIVVIHLFQYWCPGCAKRGFPVHKKLEDEFAKADDVRLFHLQTVFEDRDPPVNTAENGLKLAKKFKVEVPIGYDSHFDGSRISTFMWRFGTGGTPWTIVIDKQGVVRMNQVTPEFEEVEKLVKKLQKEEAKKGAK